MENTEFIIYNVQRKYDIIGGYENDNLPSATDSEVEHCRPLKILFLFLFFVLFFLLYKQGPLTAFI